LTKIYEPQTVSFVSHLLTLNIILLYDTIRRPATCLSNCFIWPSRIRTRERCHRFTSSRYTKRHLLTRTAW